jgi:hypothetical protein
LASPEVTALEAVEALFPSPAERTAWLAACRSARGGPVPCLLEARYAGEAASLKTALALYARTGSVAGPDEERWVERRDGARAHLSPALPVGPARKPLERVAGALYDVNEFLAELGRLRGRSPRFRATGLRVRFFRLEGPGGAEVYAAEGQLAVPIDAPPARPARGPARGGAARAADARPPVSRDDVLRALARLNDAEHGEWSARALEATYRAVVERCGGDARCLARYDPRAPGGAPRSALFRPGGDPADYGAEVIVRYYAEQRAVLTRGHPDGPAFRCAAPENAAAWSLVSAEFFAGFDGGIPCP